MYKYSNISSVKTTIFLAELLLTFGQILVRETRMIIALIIAGSMVLSV